MSFKDEECSPGFSQDSPLKIHMQSNAWDKPISVNSDERDFQSVQDWKRIDQPLPERESMYMRRMLGRLFNEF